MIMRVLTRTSELRRGVCVLGAMTLLTGVGACQRSGADGAPTAGRPASQSPASPLSARVVVSVTPADAAAAVAPNAPVVVTAAGGRLASVTVTSTKGPALTGRLSPDRTRWTSTGPLAYSTRYFIAGTATDARRSAKQIASTFTTVTPAALSYPSVIPLQGETVGVGLPVIIYWSHAVKDRVAAERLLKVTSDKPAPGSWHWMSSTEVHYRPQVFWPAYAHVSVHIGVGGADLGGGVYGEKSRTIAFTVGSSIVSQINNATKTMTVSQDGKPLRTMPVSLGKATTPTSAGTMVVITKYDQKYFDSASFGVPRGSAEGYYTKVYWDTKYTYGGEYVHAAPWSTGQQGSRNVSHGCVNVSTANAEWFYHLSKRGDVVRVVGTERAVRPGDGFTDWNVSWANWVAGSALA